MDSNRIKVLEMIPQDPTNYDDFQDIAPYNLLDDGKWTSLWMNRHPLYHKIRSRLDENYQGKLLWSELNRMKEKIEKLKKERWDSIRSANERDSELRSLIKEQKTLCKEEKTCTQTLQKHLDKCTDGCDKYFLCYPCEFKDNGRCSHYYEIKRAVEELEMEDYFDHEQQSEILRLGYIYERALAVKEDRLEEYLRYDEL
jgi:hypothetical protein